MIEFESASWNWDIREDRVQLDDSFRSLLGYQPDPRPVHFEFLCQSVHPQDLQPFRSALESLVHGDRASLDLNCRLCTRWGEEREVAAFAEVIERAPGGGALRIGGKLRVPHRSGRQRAA